MRGKRLLLLVVVLALLVAASVTLAMARPAADVEEQVSSLGIFSGGKWTAHYRAPSDAQVELTLADKGISPDGAEARAKAVEAFRQEWAERNPTTPNPKKLQELLKNERQGEPGLKGEMADFKSLAVPVEFPATETFDWYGEPITATGPLHNEIPAPGPRDNNTIWYEDATPALYNELFFGVGPKAGIVVNHPNLGTVDLRGNTMANYYLEQSEGEFAPQGSVYSKWLQAAHPEAWYGADNESGSNHNIRADELVVEVVDAVNADDPDFPWQNYDGNNDGVVDNFTVIHAGAGQEAGGGVQGDFSIWSHASAIGYPTGYLACAAGTHGATRNIYVREYSMDPENIDVGVIAEEYGHAAFGLPDIYTTDYQASPSNWAIMESGSWNGILGGMQPAPFPLYFRYLIGWADPVTVDYSTAPIVRKVGQLSKRPADTRQGIKIDLPDQVVTVDNRAGTGNAWWSTRANLADFYLARDFNLVGSTAPIFSFASYWSFEEDYDYGYLEVSTDGGSTWTALDDMDAFMADDGGGTMALNGEGSGTLRFDLTAYAGQNIDLRLHYVSDVGVQWAGWWADDFLLVDGATTLFSDDCDPEPDTGWSTNAFTMVPKTDTYPLYYLAEWRNNSGFDRGLKYAYQTVYSDDTTNEWEVDRSPYTVPGMLLWLRNGAYDFDYTLGDSWYDLPSYGPKHALTIVDSHYWPLTWNNINTASGVPLKISSRCQPSNAAFTLQKTTPFTLRLGYDPYDGAWLDDPLEVKTFKAQPAVSQFHDSLGYYPGIFYNWMNGAYFWQAEASTVVPAAGPYTTRITWPNQQPATYLYGWDWGDTIMGSGDPRDSGVQYGVNIAVLSKATNGTWGKIAVWNARSLGKVTLKAYPTSVKRGGLVKYTLTITNRGPAPQRFKVTAPIPANTTFAAGRFYNRTQKSIVWSRKLAPYGSTVLTFWVKVKSSAPHGTVIENTATLVDDANGSVATAKVTVK